jgi:hypothetical protein
MNTKIQKLPILMACLRYENIPFVERKYKILHKKILNIRKSH